MFTGDFTQPTIDYYVNEKPSSIAPKVTDAAANAVEAAVNENFVKTVSEKVVETTQKVGAEAQRKPTPPRAASPPAFAAPKKP